ncbi:MAG: cell division protein ZipA C-terminal FtsZ-binding domain-containing protein [Thiocapsa sp.]|nr:cell division protein ZipA C-terminal FtsZ-binding domain-containing protein [Thiocapsa sp.]MCG6984304.1 cell division protein ZipA C-terminal FtsZ-binding domain-containing protein [Thiocapsa sp.]
MILIVAGALLILALYLWERSRDSGDEDEDNDLGSEAPYGLSSAKREPSLGRSADSDPVGGSARSRATPDRASHPTSAAEASGAGAASERFQSGLPEPLLIQLSISARREPFDGPDLMDAAEACGLRPGNMDIFHCLDEFDDDTRVYFSMANMVKPGTFPFDAMDDFSTPGLMLFAQLEGRPEDMTILEEMIATARKLANELDGDVLDDTRRPLTVRKEEVMREAVLENERRWARVAER